MPVNEEEPPSDSVQDRWREDYNRETRRSRASEPPSIADAGPRSDVHDGHARATTEHEVPSDEDGGRGAASAEAQLQAQPPQGARPTSEVDPPTYCQCGDPVDQEGDPGVNGLCATCASLWGADRTPEEWEADIVADLPSLLRSRTCPAGEPHTGDNPDEDHGHTDCYLMRLAAREIERLRGNDG